MTVREGWKREVEKACGGVKMGCIMTPMPNHLSTYLSSAQPQNHTKQCGNKEKRSGVGMEQMRRMVRSVDKVK